MATERSPYDPHARERCSCGRHATLADHESDDATRTDPQRLSAHALETALVSALFPNGAARRRWLQAVGAATAAAAVAEFLPVGALTAMAQDRGPLEKKDLTVGFIPITCS
ncbi:MAG TPA: nitrate ABC transporter substrate-binding protein, partial [Casimicrobiaceae bacterium]